MPLLLLSNSRDPSGRFLDWARPHIADLLGPARQALFVPFAAVTISWDEYAARAAAFFGTLGVAMRGAHQVDAPEHAIREADAIVIGGGNTFHLLRELYARALLEPIRARARAGAPYVGWSAGSVVACPTIETTNDMPIVRPPGIGALGLVPFQINAHYTEAHPPGFQGETRAERLAEFVVVHPAVRVVALREGAMLRVDDGRLRLLGDAGAVIFEHGCAPREHAPGADLSALL